MSVYLEIENRLKKSKQKFDNFTIGKSYLGEDIVGFHLGKYKGPQILLTGGIHAREYLSTLFLLEEIKYLSKVDSLGGFYILPLLNPDGTRLSIEGVDFIKDSSLQKFLLEINGKDDFSLWKANSRGVDLNVNFDARWGKGKQNIFKAASANYVGECKNSEIETQNVVNFLKQHKLAGSFSFHTKGEVIYYGFNLTGQKLEQDKIIASNLAKINGYSIEKTKDSTGGLTDYMRERCNVPSFTIELGNDNLSHPLGPEHLSAAFDLNKNLPLSLLESVSN